ncbi:MAG TPA: hypothetical protein VG123_35235 [Streptosporangiaceae bacterium]|nr:hypothetical protein [Streptosporangiaceae bacterium]
MPGSGLVVDAGPITAQLPPDGLGSAAAGPSQPARSGRATAATTHAAASAAFADALVSVSWALGGHGLIRTVGGYTAQPAHQKGATPVLLARAAAVAKAAGALLALALVRPPGRVIPRAGRRRPRPRPACC